MSRGGEGTPNGRCTHLGSCPICGTEIPSSDLLIRYESPDEWPRLFASCPKCADVVSPE